MMAVDHPDARQEDLMTLRAQIHALKLKGESIGQIAAALGVCEGTVRYHVRRHGCVDGRKNKPRKIAAVALAVDQWILARDTLVVSSDSGRRPYLRDLHEWLRKEHGYEGSRRSVERYVREKYPRLQRRSKVVPTEILGALEGFEPSWV